MDEENALIDLFTTDAEIEIKKAFSNKNNLIDKKITLEITASDDIDQLHKGNYPRDLPEDRRRISDFQLKIYDKLCLLYTSPSPRDVEESRMPSSA